MINRPHDNRRERIFVDTKISKEIKEGKQVFTVKEIGDANVKGLVDIYHNNEFIAVGYINPKSNLRLRIISYEKDFDLYELFVYRLRKAKKQRERIYNGFYRWVYSEADFLSGLIIDKYNDIVVIENSNPYFEQNLDILVKAILDLDKDVESIYLKGKYRSRANEGLSTENKFLYGNKAETIIDEGGVKFLVNVVSGQKTGFFIDQRENRLLFGKLAYGKVLDVFSYTGGFGIHALINSNVEEVVFVEKDKRAVRILEENLKLNDVKDKAKIIIGDAFKVLKKINEKFNVINLDPAGLAVSGTKKSKAFRSLFVINSLASRIAKEDSLIVTSDCSYHVKREEFRNLIFKVFPSKRLIYEGRQSLDHPVHPKHKELEYLKTLFLI